MRLLASLLGSDLHSAERRADPHATDGRDGRHAGSSRGGAKPWIVKCVYISIYILHYNYTTYYIQAHKARSLKWMHVRFVVHSMYEFCGLECIECTLVHRKSYAE